MKILVFKDGSTREITGEAGKYWLTGEDRVRKLSRSIGEIREIPDPETEAVCAAELAAEKPQKPEKKKSQRKKKEDAEEKSDGECGE